MRPRSIGLLALATLAGCAPVRGRRSPDSPDPDRKDPLARPGWTLLYDETFAGPLDIDGAPWVRDPLGAESPWAAGPLGDDGEYFRLQGGADFDRQLASFHIYRKRVPFGRDGWLTAELAARDSDRDGRPESPPSLKAGSVGGEPAGLLSVPSHHGGLLIRSTRPLPPRYRVEAEVAALDFGGSRGGSWERDGRVNGHSRDEARTSHPWSWGPGPHWGRPAEEWPDARSANGFYFLAILDHAAAAPHNNVFIHTRRKAVIDAYNVMGPPGLEACDLESRRYFRSQDNTVNAFFLTPGTPLESRAMMETECGLAYGGEGGRTGFVAAGQIHPERMAAKPFRFAIERDGSGYVLEVTASFEGVGRRTLRYRRGFEQEGRPIWRYNQEPGEYDGSHDAPWAYEGPGGRLALEHSWPKGSAYPETFVIGDPHINYYEGTAALSAVRLYVPAGP